MKLERESLKDTLSLGTKIITFSTVNQKLSIVCNHFLNAKTVRICREIIQIMLLENEYIKKSCKLYRPEGYSRKH